jgi:hypothetical protein
VLEVLANDFWFNSVIKAPINAGFLIMDRITPAPIGDTSVVGVIHLLANSIKSSDLTVF